MYPFLLYILVSIRGLNHFTDTTFLNGISLTQKPC